MDVTPLRDIKPAPRAVFDRLPTHRHRVRFQVRSGGAWQPVTWGQFAQQLRGVARWLVEHELEPGDRGASYAANSVAWAAAALGAQTAGAVFVPIYPASTADQVSYILDHAEIRFVFVAGKDQVARLEKARSGLTRAPQVIDLESGFWREPSQRDAEAPTLVDARLGALDIDQPAQMLYTSGTSGNPKGVPLTYRNVGDNGRGWLGTGDVGRFTDDGFLQIIDRKKDILVNSGGKNIPPANIEAKFVDDPVIDRLVVYGAARPYHVAAEGVRAAVPAGERDRRVAQRIDEIYHQLARHETIKRHFIAEAPLGVDDGSLTSALKLRRKAVYDRLRDRFEGLYA